jgi:Outer membrane efflux protein
MDRIGKIAIVFGAFASPLLSQACQAQSSPAAAAPGTTGSASANPVPPPRPFVIAAMPVQSQPQPPKPSVPPPTQPIPTTVSPAIGPAQTRPGQNLPQPMPGAPTIGPRIRSITEEQFVTFKPAPLEPTDMQFPINLATALRLADARPLIVAAAQASVWVAEAQLTRAKVLWVPQLNIGGDYIRHDGGGPDFNKGIMTAPSVNFFYGGAGMTQNVALTDAYFQPLVSRQVLNSRQWDIQTAKNDSLMMVADAYFQVHQHRGMFAGALYAVERGHDLIERIAQLSRELVPAVEVERARNLVADLEQQATSSRENWRVQSANLTQLLRLDPRAVVVPLEHDHLQVTLIDAGRQLDDLIPVGLTNRPELASQGALVQAVANAIRRERGRMLLPSLLINGFQTPNEMIQAGIFGLGPNSSMNQWTGRDDLSYQLLWELEGFGVGNLARIKEQRGEQSKTIIELFKVQDKVAADVTRAQARLQSATARVTQADRALRTAIVTFNGNFEGLRQTTRLGDVLVLVNRPQEAVFALQLLKIALDEYFTTVADYNRAQFEMFHALGYPAKELTIVHTPGEVQPVNTERPAYLPHVGEGPPPASR